MNISIYTLTSALHDAKAVDAVTQEFLSGIGISYTLKGDDVSDYGHDFSLIYVRTGGTEGIFARLLPQLRAQSQHPFYLLTSGKSNSLAASMEILSYLRQHDEDGEILHGSPTFVAHRIGVLCQAHEARKKLQGMRLGIIGAPSDWLISSHADDAVVREHMGIEMEHIDMSEIIGAISTPKEQVSCDPTTPAAVREALPGAIAIYEALKHVVEKHGLQGFTLRCFDLLTAVHNTGCLALARLNAEGIVAGCEGDVPTMLTMALVRAITGVSGFQANPSSIDPEKGEMVFAHCTIPLDMVESHVYDTHFESGIGVGIRGHMQEGGVTIVKLAGDCSRLFVAEGELLRNESKADLCRTQLVIRLDKPRHAAYFLTHPIGNHHVVVAGRWKEQLKAIAKYIL
ncbi:MAG: hypothetical protein J5637_02615 [Prevotella sp.]|nr:hypothetical protein [Prevotella sp.]